MTIPANPPVKSGWMQKKLFGVPVVYLAVGFVIILALVAWRLKPAKTPADTTTDATATAEDLNPAVPTGTVYAQNPQTGDEPIVETNDTWMRKGLAFLIAKGENPGTVQLALQHYLAGNDLTYDEGRIRDAVVAEYGLPPDINDIGGTGSKPLAPAKYPSHTAGYSKYVVVKSPTDPNGSIYGIGKDNGIMYRLGPAEWAALGKPKISQIINTKVTPKPAPKPAPKSAPKPAPPPAPRHGTPYPGVLIRQGSRGPNVVLIQKVVHVTPDGIYGPVTKNAVTQFQRSHRLAADGIVGPLTWKAMFG